MAAPELDEVGTCLTHMGVLRLAEDKGEFTFAEVLEAERHAWMYRSAEEVEQLCRHAIAALVRDELITEVSAGVYQTDYRALARYWHVQWRAAYDAAFNGKGGA